MTDREIEQLAELIAMKTADKTVEKVVNIADKMIIAKIALHSAQCEVGRLSAAKTAVVAVLSSTATLIGSWLINKI